MFDFSSTRQDLLSEVLHRVYQKSELLFAKDFLGDYKTEFIEILPQDIINTFTKYEGHIKSSAQWLLNFPLYYFTCHILGL